MDDAGTQAPSERKLVLYTLMSLDGAVDDPGAYFAGSEPGGPPQFDSVMGDNERDVIGTQDAVLLGRNMYDEWSRFWPTVDEWQFADFINLVKKYVVTSTPLANAWHNAEAVAGPIEDLVRRAQGPTRPRYRRPRQHRARTVAAHSRPRRRAPAGGRSGVRALGASPVHEHDGDQSPRVAQCHADAEWERAARLSRALTRGNP